MPDRVLRDGELLPYAEAVSHAVCKGCGRRLAWKASVARGAMFAVCCKTRYWLEAVNVKVSVESE
jgi:hypothetical protein